MLKSLELAGFKSFADRTRFEFPAGVTVVVGPNGSGKSNVVDAVKWVLGSQSPRSLRGKEMTDVIFNGAVDRRPLNTAEVTLSFDNPEPPEGQRRLFELNEPEIHLTRRVYRSGEGEYLINGQTCRLRDFRELLAGTGVGADGYSIIEQGRVDAALQASPMDRRLLFEEAAGISRFRLKKREAMRRLDRVEQNLLRLSDIVDEVEGRLRRVRAQAGKAQRYREQTERLKRARTLLGRADWKALTEAWNRLDAEHSDLAQRLAATRSLVKEQEEKLGHDTPAGADQNSAELLAQEEERYGQIRERLAHARSQAELHRQRADDLAVEIDQRRQDLCRARQERIDSESRAEQASDPLAAARATHAKYAQAIADAKRSAEQSSRAAQEARDRLSQQKESVKQLEAEAERLAKEERGLREQRAAASQAIETFQSQQTEAASHQAESAEELAAASALRDAATDRLLQLDKQSVEAQHALSAKRKELASAQQRLAATRESLISVRHRLESLAAEQERLQRLNQDVAALLTGQDGAPRVLGLVADVLHVDIDFAAMVEAALGAAADQVIVDSRDALLGTLADNPEALSVRAAFRWADASPPTALDQVDLSDEPGVIGRASDFVETDPELEPLVRRLLGRTWLVDQLATASRLADSIGRGLSFVTADGQNLSAEGVLTAGPRDESRGALTLRQESERLRVQAQQIEASIGGLTKQVESLESHIEQAEQAVTHAAEQATHQRAELAAAAQRAAALDERCRQSQTTTDRLKDSIAERTAEGAELEQQLASIAQRLQSNQSAIEQSKDQTAQLNERIRQAESQHAAAEARLAEQQHAAEHSEQLIDSLLAESPSVVSGKDPREAEREAAKLLEGSLRRQESCQSEALRARSDASELAIHSQEASQQLRQRRSAERAAQAIRSEVEVTLRQAREESDELVKSVAQAELRRQQVDLERRSLVDRLRDEHAIDVTLADDLNENEHGPIDREALRAEVDKLRQQVAASGAVNLESLDELDELENRFKELSSQFEDLSQAKASLVRLTGKINSDSRELFLASFETVRDHFKELFARLFGGGQADLVLTESSDESAKGDPLEGGVEIVACPPGKELRNLSLLSGGEKTMTCVALLLALFRSKPSPFCLLDEVDAALDEANVGRFASVLSEFLSSTQFIVVSHSKRTMSAADTLYGVTMQQSGVSKQVSVRFEEVSEDGQIRLRKGQSETNSTRRAA